MPLRINSRVRVGIYAPLAGDGIAGGIEQFTLGLVRALAAMDEEEQEYVILCHPQNPEWLKPYLGKNQVLQVLPQPKVTRGLETVLRLSGFNQTIKRRVNGWLSSGPAKSSYLVYEPQRSDGFLETLNLDVVHFPYQRMVLTSIPSIYSPWDLQHLHYPLFFSPREVAAREAYYPIGCRSATCIAVASSWTKDDIAEKYGIDPNRIHVIPIAPATSGMRDPSSEHVRDVRERFHLPPHFAFFPAQTWPHKNHLRLLRAIAHLRDERNLLVYLVCTGAVNDYWHRIAQEIEGLGLQSQVFFLGFVPTEDVRSLYTASDFVVLPTLFEGGCFPMLEALAAGVPVACSTVTHLPEQAGGAALLFDPTSVPAIAESIYQLATDSCLRERLRAQGLLRAKNFTWDRTAEAYRNLYREIASQRRNANHAAFDAKLA